MSRREVVIGNVVKRDGDSYSPSPEVELEKQKLVDFINTRVVGFGKLFSVEIKTGAYAIKVSYYNKLPPTFKPELYKQFPHVTVDSDTTNLDIIYLPFNSFARTKRGQLWGAVYRTLNFLKYLVIIIMLFFMLYLQHLNKPRKYHLFRWS